VTAILALWNDCAPEALNHYERWYAGEHLEERVGVPGFRYGRRYEAIEADRRFFTYYEVDSPAVLSSQPYVDRLNAPTEWTRRAMASFRGTIRTVCDLTYTTGRMHGAYAVTLRLSKTVPAFDDSVLAEIACQNGVARLQIWTAASAQTPPKTKELASRGGQDETAAGAIIVECLRLADVEQISGDLIELANARLGNNGAYALGLYAFLCSQETNA